jgi:hypothetical protein
VLTGDDKVAIEGCPCIHMGNSSVNNCLYNRVLHVCTIKSQMQKCHRVLCCDPCSCVIEVVSLICVLGKAVCCCYHKLWEE